MPWLKAIKGHHLGSVWMCWTSIPRCARRPQVDWTSVDWSGYFWYPKVHDVSIETDSRCEILGPKPSKATGFPHLLSILFLPKKYQIELNPGRSRISGGVPPTVPSRIVWSASKGFGSWRPALEKDGREHLHDLMILKQKWPFDPFRNEVNYMWKSMLKSRYLASADETSLRHLLSTNSFLFGGCSSGLHRHCRKRCVLQTKSCLVVICRVICSRFFFQTTPEVTLAKGGFVCWKLAAHFFRGETRSWCSWCFCSDSFSGQMCFLCEMSRLLMEKPRI